MRCRHCDTEPGTPNEPAYCPHCGSEFEQKTREDVDWPLRLEYAPRVNVHRMVSEETGIDEGDALWEFHDDVEVIIELVVHEDGTEEVGGERR